MSTNAVATVFAVKEATRQVQKKLEKAAPASPTFTPQSAIAKPPDPQGTDTEVQRAIERERELQRRRQGRGRSILTSPQGLGAGNQQQKTLLGA